MKPRKLRIAGLNSFVEEQLIDFEKLTQKGLFGIFGPTGSGKSTILDAITIAMYGEISRGTSEYINSQREDLFVSYEFEIGSEQNRCIYIIDRHIKRDKTGTGYTTKQAVLRQVIDGETKILCDKAREIKNNIISIIGLNCDDFTRSVVLPQGKFSEFLKLRGSERREMLERIFNLKKYGTDFSKKIREIKRQYQSELDKISGSLEKYGDISEEAYEEKLLNLKCLKEEEEKLRYEKAAFDREYERVKILWELQNELNTYLGKLNSLILEQPAMENKKNMLSRAENALIVKPFIDDNDSTNFKIQKSLNELQILEAELENSLKALEETERTYNAAYEKKERELAGLIQREANLNTVIEMDAEIERLKSEIQKLLDRHKLKRNDIKQLEAKMSEAESNKKSSNEEAAEVEDELDKVKVLPEYREKIINAADIEREYIKLQDDIKRQNIRASEIGKNIEKASGEHGMWGKKLEVLAEQIKNLEDKKISLSRNCPADSSVLLRLQKEIQDIENAISTFNDYKNKCDTLEGELKGILNSVGEKTLEVKVAAGEFNLYSERYEETMKQIDEMERQNAASLLAAKLSIGEPCPVCGSVHHPKVASTLDENMILNKRIERDKVKDKVDELSKSMNSLQIELGICKSNATGKRSQLDEYSQKLQNIDIQELEGSKRRLEVDFLRLKDEISKWEHDSRDTEEKLTDAREEKGRIEAKIAALNSELVKDKLQLDEIKLELKDINDSFEATAQRYNKFKTDTGVQDFSVELKAINEKTRREDVLRKKQSSLVDRVRQLDNEIKNINESINNEKLDLAKIEESGKMMRLEIDKRVEARDKYYDGDNPSEYLNQVRVVIKSIQDNEAALKKKLDEEKRIYQQRAEMKVKEEENLKGLKQLADDQRKRLNEVMLERGFEAAEEVAAAMIGNDEMLILGREIEKHTNTMINTKDNIARIESKLNGETVQEEAYLSLINKRNESSVVLEEKTKIIAAEENDINRMRRDLDEVKVLLQKEKQTRHILDVLGELDNVTGASKFVEFISTSQLKYIAIEASRRLSDITRGRYALELDSNGEFVMRDDYNGGMRRSVDTLSGGETFLTSLSLALALSSHIQLKGKAPLEFFFLDEGFGTLDSELLETVMSSLERLHSDRLCVGIISHVEEIKSRVPVKLIVFPAVPGSGGTRVEIEYS